MKYEIIIALILPFLGTLSGAVLAQIVRVGDVRIINGFAAGFMVAASFWSLLLPSMEGGIIPCCVGFVLAAVMMSVFERLAPRGDKTAFAIMLHNAPEGMAVGAALMAGAAGIPLAVGVAIQNIPEGAIVSVPLSGARRDRINALAKGAVSGIIEPIFAVVMFALHFYLDSLLPYFLSFAAGAMLHVAAGDLLSDVGQKGVIGFMAGFFLMMLLDVAL